MDFQDTLPPVAEQQTFAHVYHHQEVEDPYHWLRQEGWTQETGVTNPKILAYLNAENAYAKKFFDKHQQTLDEINQELIDLVDVDDVTFPVSIGDYGYYTKSLKGKNYPQHWRKNLKTNLDELLLDENELAHGYEYFKLGFLEHSPDHRYLAYAFDIDGSERMTLKIKDTEKNELLPFEISEVSGNGLVWANDKKSFYFQKVDENWRSNTVHFASIDNQNSTLVFSEDDHTNHVGIRESSDHQFLFISSGDAHDNVTFVQSLNNNEVCLNSPLKRKKNVLYSMDSQDDKWIILINDKGPNKRLISLNYEEPLEKAKTLYEDLPIIEFSVYKTFISVLAKREGLPALFFIQDSKISEVCFNEKSFTLDLIQNDYNNAYCHIQISSLSTPVKDILIDHETFYQEIVRSKQIPGYDQSQYVTDRLWATSQDGAKIPYTIAYKKDITLGSTPVYLYGYGSYGYALDVDFRASFIPLLNRGYIVALAHIRGGADLGRAWYEAAKLKTKKKTFEDFIACAHDLIEKGYTKKGHISIAGGSAGGMLMGTVINMEPDLFQCAIAMVPFVDVINTMMDDKLPLTPGEYSEWGNPQEKDYYDYMRTYSPYDNVKKQNLPTILVTAGLNDPRVTYWEPAKWVAKLRTLKTDKNILLLDTEMGAGHGGPSGKFGYLKEVSKRYTFIMMSRQ